MAKKKEATFRPLIPRDAVDHDEPRVRMLPPLAWQYEGKRINLRKDTRGRYYMEILISDYDRWGRPKDRKEKKRLSIAQAKQLYGELREKESWEKAFPNAPQADAPPAKLRRPLGMDSKPKLRRPLGMESKPKLKRPKI